MTARAPASSLNSPSESPGEHRVEVGVDPAWTKAGEGMDDLTCLAARCCQLSTRSVAQFDGRPSELQVSAEQAGESTDPEDFAISIWFRGRASEVDGLNCSLNLS